MAVAAAISMIILVEGMPRAEPCSASQRRRPAALGSALYSPRTSPDC